MNLSSHDALENARHNSHRKYPNKTDSRFLSDRVDMLVPGLRPRFHFSTPCTIFAMGSCFARNIEDALEGLDVDIPTRRFAVPTTEWPYRRPNGLLNEFNPGTISQRILSAIDHQESSDDTLLPEKDGFADLLLPGGNPVSLDRAKQRRREIYAIYQQLAAADVIIITLGLTEAWFDNETRLFLNRIPPAPFLQGPQGRFVFKRLDVADSYPLIEKAMASLVNAGIRKILVTVSPVPLAATFMPHDAVVANSFSKSVLRVCAQLLTERFQEVDYFPSYEMVTSCGLHACIHDNVHIKDEVVRLVTRKMLDAYLVN